MDKLLKEQKKLFREIVEMIKRQNDELDTLSVMVLDLSVLLKKLSEIVKADHKLTIDKKK